MEYSISNSILKYIHSHRRGGLIDFSDLVQFCSISEDKLLAILLRMEDDNKLKIVRRYFCPEFHPIQISSDSLCFCLECDYSYPVTQLESMIYVKPT